MSEDNDRKVLKFFARTYLEIMRSNDKLVKFINFGQMENPDLFKIPYFQNEESPLRLLSSYLDRRMKEGRFKRKKPPSVKKIHF